MNLTIQRPVSGKILCSLMLSFLIASCPTPQNDEPGKAIFYAPETVLVAGGTFDMGDDTAFSSDEKPQHSLTISDVNMGKYEITCAQFVLFLNDVSADSNGSVGGENYIGLDGTYCPIIYGNGEFAFSSNSRFPSSDCPVGYVTWNGADKYCNWLSAKTLDSYRLPTEAEWEFAARGGASNERTDYSGSSSLDSVGWFFSNSQTKSHPVGTKNSNSLGLYDMSGNINEWCHDYYDSDYYSYSPDTDPQGAVSGSERVLRGGAYGNSTDFCRIAYRYFESPDTVDGYYGFRVVKENNF